MKLYGKAQTTCQTIINTFEHPEELPAALAPIFIHRRDEAPCRVWSWSNQMMCALNGTGDARGYRQWQGVGRHVKKGGRAFHILVPITIRKSAQGNEDEDAYAVIGFKAAPVFGFDQTDGEPLPKDEYADWIADLPLIDVARSWGVSVDVFNGEGGRTLGRTSPGRAIALGVENASTWAHELIHNADHKATGPLKGGQSLNEEIVAELGGAVLLKCLGHDQDADLGGCFEYCKHYADQNKKHLLSVLTRLLDRTCRAVDLVLQTAERIETERAAA